MSKKIILFIFLLNIICYGQTSRFQKTFRDSDGDLVQGSSIYIVNQHTSQQYNLTEHPTLPGVYYHTAVPYGHYNIYVDGSLRQENYYFGAVRQRTFIENVDPDGNNQIDTQGIENDAITEIKLANLSATNSKLGNNSVTSDKIYDMTIGTNDINSNAITDSKILNNEISWNKLNEALKDSIRAGGMGTIYINNSPDDTTVEEVSNKLKVKRKYNTWEVAKGNTYYTTIQEVHDLANAGDIIKVFPGIYNDDISISKNISIIGNIKDQCIINGTLTIISTSGCDIKDLTLNAVICTTASGVINIDNCEIGKGSLYFNADTVKITNTIWRWGSTLKYMDFFGSTMINLQLDDFIEKTSLGMGFCRLYNQCKFNLHDSKIKSGLAFYDSTQFYISNCEGEGRIHIGTEGNNSVIKGEISNCNFEWKQFYAPDTTTGLHIIEMSSGAANSLIRVSNCNFTVYGRNQNDCYPAVGDPVVIYDGNSFIAENSSFKMIQSEGMSYIYVIRTVTTKKVKFDNCIIYGEKSNENANLYGTTFILNSDIEFHDTFMNIYSSPLYYYNPTEHVDTTKIFWQPVKYISKSGSWLMTVAAGNARTMYDSIYANIRAKDYNVQDYPLFMEYPSYDIRTNQTIKYNIIEEGFADGWSGYESDTAVVKINYNYSTTSNHLSHYSRILVRIQDKWYPDETQRSALYEVTIGATHDGSGNTSNMSVKILYRNSSSPYFMPDTSDFDYDESDYTYYQFTIHNKSTAGAIRISVQFLEAINISDTNPIEMSYR